jgi:hypothetical protein
MSHLADDCQTVLTNLVSQRNYWIDAMNLARKERDTFSSESANYHTYDAIMEQYRGQMMGLDYAIDLVRKNLVDAPGTRSDSTYPVKRLTEKVINESVEKYHNVVDMYSKGYETGRIELATHIRALMDVEPIPYTLLE